MQRTEIKYVLSLKNFHYLKATLPQFFQPDPNCHPRDGYQVTSLYFDTSDFKSFYEKIDGANTKTKWRLRQYNSDPRTLRLEEKIKLGRKSYKLLHPPEHPMQLSQKLLVDYQRLAFMGNGLRITLDYNLGYRLPNNEGSLDMEPDNYRRVETILLEVKEFQSSADSQIIAKLISSISLKSSPFSKYAQGVGVIYDL